jgi:DNA mismatch endonuclease (patch repair protein)
MDRLTPERRSWNMSRIKGRNTRLELVVRSVIHGLGFRFRLHGARLPGRPDIVLARHRTVVFVHGCFWHRHRRCRFAYQPKSNVAFWSEKFAGNVARDSRNRRELRRLGWRVVVVWECQAADRPALTRRLVTALETEGVRPSRMANRVRRT